MILKMIGQFQSEEITCAQTGALESTYANMHVYGMEGPGMSGCRKEVIGHKTGAML